MNNPNNYYQELNIQSNATDKEIKSAYRNLAFEYHPDRNKGNAQAADKMKSINEAYAVLSDPEKRRQYDMLFQRFGEGAKNQFRQHYSEQEIYRDSDIEQIFEEMARAFGLRGFDDIFKDFHGRGYRHFEFKQPGMFGKGLFFKWNAGSNGSENRGSRFVGPMIQKILGKAAGIFLPQRGGDLHDVIVLQPDLAVRGGPFAYYHRAKDKKLVVQIPKGVQDGQRIRLQAMGKEGTHGAAPGDLLLKVKINKPLIKKILEHIGIKLNIF